MKMFLVDTGEDLRRVRKRLRLTQSEMAERLGTTRARYKNWEYDLANPPSYVMEEVKKYNAEAAVQSAILKLAAIPMAQVPLVGKASAGPGSTAEGDDDFLSVPVHMAREGACGYIVEGDSMLPWLQPGDALVAMEHPQPKLNYAFLIRRPSGEVSVKVLKWDRGQIVYRSVNPSYKDEDPTGILMGYVIGIYRVEGTHEKMEFDPSGLKPQFD